MKTLPCVALMLIIMPGAAVAAKVPLTASLASGRIEGTAKDGVIAFLGIPYAAPPVRGARWRAPGRLINWSGTRKATAFAASCPQSLNPAEGRAPWTPEYLIPGATSEDCLYLNVWRPANVRTGRMPILVWIHGGGFIEGSGSVPIYDGAALANQGIVVITINYRLGVLGFLAHPALSAEQGGVSGNYGLQDILTALHWVHDNVAAFGGDTARVTIAGQSAGADAVNDMTGAPAAHGLFSRSITESSSDRNISLPTLDVAEAGGKSFAQAIGADTLGALRAAPAEALVQHAAEQKFHFAPIIDGRLLPSDPIRAQAGQDFNDTPVLCGFNADEDSGFDVGYGQWHVEQLNRNRDSLFGPLAEQAAKIYAASNDAEARAIGKLMLSDRSRAFAFKWAKSRENFGRQPIYLYYYEHPEPGPTQARYGTFHSAELPYVFGNLQAARPFTNDDRKVSSQMMKRWLAFIRYGSPNVPGMLNWPAFQARQPAMMHLGDNEAMEAVLAEDKLRLNDEQVEKTGSLSPHGAD